MPVKQTIPYRFGSFFITFTCYKWLLLIKKMNGYDIIYNWFDVLKRAGHYINGFVPIAIGMPNPAYRQAGTFMRLSVSQQPRS